MSCLLSLIDKKIYITSQRRLLWQYLRIVKYVDIRHLELDYHKYKQ